MFIMKKSLSTRGFKNFSTRIAYPNFKNEQKTGFCTLEVKDAAKWASQCRSDKGQVRRHRTMKGNIATV